MEQTPQEFIREYREKLQSDILEEHASLCPLPLQPIYTKGEEGSKVWKVAAVMDEGLSTDALMTLANLVERRKQMYSPKTY